MVGDDPQRHVTGLAVAVVRTGQLRDFIRDVHHGVHVEQGVHVLADHGQTLQAHAGVDVLLGQLGVVALAVVVELGKDVVPDLHIAVAVAAGLAVGAAAAELLAAVVIDLRAGAAGTGAVLPEVVFLAHAVDAVLRDAHFVPPDVEGLVVLLVDGGIQPVLFQAHPLGVGQKLPGPGNGLVLKVIAEGEVAQHLEIGAVAGGVADVLDVARPDTFLAGADPAAGRLLLPLEPRLHGGHAGVDEQQGGVVLRHQGEAGQAQVSLGLKEGQEHLSQFVQSIILMHNIPPM